MSVVLDSALGELFGTALEVVDLEHPRKQGMPVFEAHEPGYAYFLHRRHEDSYDPDLSGPRTSASGFVVAAEHSGTHIDAICHQAEDLRLYGGTRSQDTTESRGFGDHGADEIDPIVAPGVLLDVAALLEVPSLEPEYAVSADELELCSECQGIAVEPGDVVLVRTGGAQHWGDSNRYQRCAGMAASASDWLADRGVSAVGADNLAWDVVGSVDPGLGCQLPGHLLLLARRGIYIVENLNLEGLAAFAESRFLFICIPLKLVGATASPVRPLALVNTGRQQTDGRWGKDT